MRLELPGFCDIQVNGFAGIDFNDPQTNVTRIDHAFAAMRATGVTLCLPTIITSSYESFAACAQTLARYDNPANAGLHMEGPYISPEDGARGAHPLAHVRPASIEDFKRRQDAAAGRITLVTLAPEIAGALELTEYLVARNIRVAIGHTAATPEQIRAAIASGATMSTHLGNGAMNMLPRHPNFIWEQLAADELLASFIVDGHHLPPATVKAMIRAKTPERSMLVTDAITAAACPPGRYVLGETVVELNANGRVSEPGKPWLAGSALTMDNAVVNTVRFTGLSIHDVWPMASMRPAAYMRLPTPASVTAEWDELTGQLTIETGSQESEVRSQKDA
ncbi:MAG: N-acetylglucosamine-6-phosphate deacetylase [Blastocatellia bacterium]